MNHFNFDILSSVLGEIAAIDIPRLYIYDREQAVQFLLTYGFDIEKNIFDLERLWDYHAEAIDFLEAEILSADEKIPSLLRERNELQDIAKLLLIASVFRRAKDTEERGSAHSVLLETGMDSELAEPERISLQRWACAILRVMHVFVHLHNDLFTAFTDDVKYQILKPIQDHIHYVDNKIFLGKEAGAVELAAYAEKPFKHSHSAAIKILTRKNTLAMTLLDRVGVRFVTKDVTGIFKVIQYLIDKHLISYPHVISSQSKNTICPTAVFMKIRETYVKTQQDFPEEEMEAALQKELLNLQLKADSELNPYTNEDFKFLKFINRQFLRVNLGKRKKNLSFFFPYEVQILDQKTFENNEKGQASHQDYKQRQRLSARERVLGV